MKAARFLLLVLAVVAWWMGVWFVCHFDFLAACLASLVVWAALGAFVLLPRLRTEHAWRALGAAGFIVTLAVGEGGTTFAGFVLLLAGVGACFLSASKLNLLDRLELL